MVANAVTVTVRDVVDVMTGDVVTVRVVVVGAGVLVTVLVFTGITKYELQKAVAAPVELEKHPSVLSFWYPSSR